MLNSFDGDFIQYNKNKLKEENSNLSWFLAIHITLYVIVVFFAVFFIWFTVFNTTHHFYAVEGASMKNTLNSSISNDDGKSSIDAVYVNTKSKVEVFDVVVIKRENKVKSHTVASFWAEILCPPRKSSVAAQYLM